MIRRLAAVAFAGLILAGCGSIKLSTAMVSWVRDNGFAASTKTLGVDAAHLATALRSPSTGVNELHTVTGVLLLAAQSAQTQLPTPDDQATHLLNDAYGSLGAAANVGYNAAHHAATRAKALTLLAQGLAKLSEASARVATSSVS